jgi:chromosome segregation ATPase
MKLNAILPWILVVALGAGVATLYVKGSAKDADLAKLRQDNAELEQVRTELSQTREQSKTQQDEIETLRNDTKELLSLRNEIGKIRDEKEKLARQLQSAQSDAQRAQAAASQAQQNAVKSGQQLASLQTDVDSMRKTNEQSQAMLVQQRNVCINNLRQLDAAKHQWALENGKTADAAPNPQDLAPYLKDNVLPLCPAGGLYTLGAVSQPVTCSIPGHTLGR